MNSKNTWFWITLAAGLFAFIFFFERHTRKPTGGPPKILPSLKASEINGLQVFPRGQLPIHVERTNGTWRLTQPLVYPAEAPLIENLLSVLEHLSAVYYISTDDLRGGDEQYGFDPPQASVMLGHRNLHLLIGNRTAPGDHVYVQVAGTEGVGVVDAGLLALIPRNASDWRNKALVDWANLKFDRLIVTNAGNILELQNSPTNGLWWMVRPIVARADTLRVRLALQRLLGLNVQEFVSDDPRPDLEAYGLQTPELSLAFFQGTNSVFLVHFGRSPTNNPAHAYARRDDPPSIVTVAREMFEPWLASHSKDFREFVDHHLILSSREPGRIEVMSLGQEPFALERQTNGTWRVQPGDFPADPAEMEKLIHTFATLQFAEIEREIVLEENLAEFGLAAPLRQYILSSVETNNAAGPTNAVIAHLSFGVNQGKEYARRKGEDFVYSMNPPVLGLLPGSALDMRDRRIWRFTEDEVASLTIQQFGRTNQLLHRGTNSWVLAPGSQGTIKNILALEQTARLLGELYAERWVARGDQDRERFGLTNAYQLTVELKDNRQLAVQLGVVTPAGLPYALATLDNESWIFEFPLALSYLVQEYLTLPANQP